MVAKIPRPQSDHIEVLKIVLAERKKFKKFYKKLELDIIAQYQLYEIQHGCPSQMNPLDLNVYTDTPEEAAARKTSLIGLYTPADEKCPFKELETLRSKNKLLSCPLCGEPGRPRTLDHFLPKTVFPEFSINLLNLVPACDWCQGEKLTDYQTGAGTRSFIHPYFDEVNTPLCIVRLKPPYLTPIMSLEVLSTLPVNMQQLVKSHFVGVNYWERFKEHCEMSYPALVRLAKSTRLGGKITVRDALESALGLATEKGVNSWDAVLYRSVLEDAEALAFLETGQLPEYA